MKVIHLNTPEIPCPGSHYFTASKLCLGFQQNGIEFIEVNTLDSIEQYNSSDNVVLLSNHFTLIDRYDAVYKLGKVLNKCVFIAWHFNFHPQLIADMPFQKYVLTGEHYRKPPQSSDSHKYCYSVAMESSAWVPYTFSSYLHPDDIGTYQRGNTYDACFIGAPYKADWSTSLPNCYTYFSDSATRFLSEDDRLNVYLNSKVCLGFHSEANIQNSCIVERVFEGMSLGCAVLSDNPVAEEITNGIVKYVSSLEEVKHYINLYKSDDVLFQSIQNAGYQYLKSQGTYYHLAQNFIKKIQELYG
jgi:hypothetical protein